MLYAFIPARAGSKRIANKNFKRLSSKSLIIYTIEAAVKAKIFDQIYISSDDKVCANIAKKYNIKFVKRPQCLAGDTSPDVGWIEHLLSGINQCDKNSYFMILRPTNPFRTSRTIIRALDKFNLANIASKTMYTGLKSIQKITERPEKMWRVTPSGDLSSYQPNQFLGIIPQYEAQSYVFQELYIQNGCIDLCSIENLDCSASYLGPKIKVFFTKGYEGFDINEPHDWDYAEYLLKKGILNGY